MNWIQRFLTTIATHKGDASAHHTKTTDASELTSGALNSENRLPNLSTGKIWQGNANRPAEVDPSNGVPSGLIAMWHGTITNIPAGYIICDGLNSTPNLLTRFVQGVATAATNPGATGGATSHKHTMPSHSHTMPSHSHPIDIISRLQGDTGTIYCLPSPSPDTDSVDPGDTNSKDPGDTNTKDGRPLYYNVAYLMKT